MDEIERMFRAVRELGRRRRMARRARGMVEIVVKRLNKFKTVLESLK